MKQNSNYNHKNVKQKRSLPYIKARIDNLINLEESKTKAFASVTIDEAVAIHGIRVMSSAKGLFVAMPASTYVDDTGKKHFIEIAHPVSKEARELLNSKVMEAYKQVLEEQQSEDETEDTSENEQEDFTQRM